jgi:molecular chaperone DnaK
MGYGVGIDLGTSFTSAAVRGPGGTRMVPLGQDMIVPSLVGRGVDGRLLTGADAQAANLEPSRLVRGFKRRLGDPSPLILGGDSYLTGELMAVQLRDTLAAVTRFAGAAPASVVLTCPAIWGQYRRNRFAEVSMFAGLANCQVITEPEAAATHYSMERRLGNGAIVAVYDLGGGTFDTTVLRVRSGGMEILGRPEGIEHLGGIDFDETLFCLVDDRVDGALSQLGHDHPATAETRALCVRVKEELSVEPVVVLTVPLPSGPREVTVTRQEFNEMIRPSVQLTTEALRRTIESASAGLNPADLSAVLLAGGSSRVPLVSQLVSKEFGKPVRVTLHPKFTVALGAAAIAAKRVAPPAMTVSMAKHVAPQRNQLEARAVPVEIQPLTSRPWLLPAAALLIAIFLAIALALLV